MNHNPYPVVELNKWKTIKAEHPGAYIRSKAGKKGTIMLAIWGRGRQKHILPVSWHPVMSNPSFEDAMSLSDKDIAAIRSANERIAGLTRYGRRIEKVDRPGGRIMSWSNGGADWWLYADRPKVGEQVDLDANQAIVYGMSGRLTRYLDPLPLYAGSFESKQRGVFDPRVWLEGHGIEEEDETEENPNRSWQRNPQHWEYMLRPHIKKYIDEMEQFAKTHDIKHDRNSMGLWSVMVHDIMLDPELSFDDKEHIKMELYNRWDIVPQFPYRWDNPHLLDYPYNLIHATRKERMISTIVGGVVGLLALWAWQLRAAQQR